MPTLTEIEGSILPATARPPAGGWHMPQAPHLLTGRVIRRHAPGEQGNRTVSFAEYDVLCDFWSDNGMQTRAVLFRCLLDSCFGGAGDFEHWEPRIVPQGPGSDQGKKPEQAESSAESRVLVLCANARTRQGYIVAGAPHPLGRVSGGVEGVDERTLTGPYWAKQYNGARISVNSDGELELLFQGATQVNGQPATTRVTGASGSRLRLAKDGQVTLTAAKGKVFLAGPEGTQIGAGTEKQVLGTTYRRAEAQSNGQVATALEATFTVLASLVGAIGKLLAEPAVAALAPSTVGTIVAALPPLTTNISQVAAGAAGVRALEAQAPAFLSTKNTLD